jgi:hypothetical protein
MKGTTKSFTRPDGWEIHALAGALPASTEFMALDRVRSC